MEFRTYGKLVDESVNTYYNESYFEKNDEKLNITHKDVLEVTNLQFQNKNLKVDYETYKKANPVVLKDRVSVTIKNALFSGIVKSLSQLGMSILYSILGTKQEGKAHFFHALQDFKESVGWITKNFNETLGSYLVESAQFMQHCYELQMNPKFTEDNPLLKKEISILKEKFTEVLNVDLQSANWVTAEWGPNMSQNTTYFSTIKTDTILAEKISKLPINEITKNATEKLFGTEEQPRSHHTLSDKSHIIYELKKGDKHFIKIDYTISRGSDGLVINDSNTVI